jgi:hypothetical protein
VRRVGRVRAWTAGRRPAPVQRFKLIAMMLWAAGVLGGLLTGVQTLAADPTNCMVCYEMEDGVWMCYHIGCGEP